MRNFTSREDLRTALEELKARKTDINSPEWPSSINVFSVVNKENIIILSLSSEVEETRTHLTRSFRARLVGFLGMEYFGSYSVPNPKAQPQVQAQYPPQCNWLGGN